jgi:cyanuric acid amidohydrolase
MVAVDILKVPTSSPADTAPLEKVLAAGYDASQILAIIGKTEGEYNVPHHGPNAQLIQMVRQWLRQ